MIGVAGAGAFGTALAIAISQSGRPVTLWCRDPGQAAAMQASRSNPARLAGARFPQTLRVTADLADLCGQSAILLAVPAQQLSSFLALNGPQLDGMVLVSCAKGLDLATLTGPSALIAAACPGATVAALTGPGFATDIARGLPTALTLACTDDKAARHLQTLLSTPTLRLYRSSDVIGAELGGALKNVMAIAAGVVIGAGLGESARAAVITRGHAEMARLAQAMGGRAETLAGLSGLGDLILTCTSAQSRNFSFGLALGAGRPPDTSQTVEGVATAHATARLARQRGFDLPICTMVSALVDAKLSVKDAIGALLNRPLKQE